MKTARSAITALLCPAHFLAGWLLGLLSLVFFFAKKPRLDPEFPYVVVVTWRDWVAQRWKYSTSVGFWIAMNPKHLARQGEEGRTRQHERVHVRQSADMGLLALLLSVPLFCVGLWKPALYLLASAPLWKVANFAGAVLRGGNIYRDSEHERSAYAQTDLVDGSSWLERKRL